MRSQFALLLALVVGAVPNDFAQLCPPTIRLQNATRDVGVNAIQPTSDGGYILSGASYPGSDGEQTSPNQGSGDVYLVKLDANFNRVWDQSFGGFDWDGARQVQELSDGFIIAGDSWSQATGNKTSPAFGWGDFWVIRTDSDGNKIWERSFGGTNYDSVFCLQKTSDGGFIIGGGSDSNASGNKSSPNYGSSDYWVIRLDGAGNKLWERSFGGAGRDELSAIQPTSDGGFLLGGTSESETGGNKTALSFESRDYWIIRIDANGNELWQKSFGGIGNDELAALGQSAAGFTLVGSSDSIHSGTKTSPNYGYRDYWIVAIDQNGNQLWEQSAGGSSYAGATAVLPTPDGGWVIGGTAGPGGGGNKTAVTEGYSDYWLVRLDSSGSILWDKTLGGTSGETFYGFSRTADGGILVAGQSTSGPGGNRTVPRHEAYNDLWLPKLGPETPGDCDGDGVPDEQDLCAGSSSLAVNTNGCSIAQLCPCDSGWTNHAEYVSCVDRTSGEFLAAGRITTAERDAVMAEAATAGCPIPPVIAFGLTNFPIHQAAVTADSENGNLFVSNLSFDGLDGVSMRLGEADSGLFFYPHAPIQDNFNENWFLQGKAYGTINGASNVLISSIRATKPYYETYPVEVDFSQLGVTSLTFQAYLGKTLIAENTQMGAIGSVTIYSASYLGPRGNPFWRAADGSIGAVIDFDVTELPYRFGLSGLIDDTESGGFADRVYVRANNPTNVVNFVSRLDVIGGGGLTDFTGLNARLGMFRRPHQILGSGLFDATAGKLHIGRRQDSQEPFAGTLIEARQENLVDATLEPITLETNSALLQLSGSGSTVVTNSGSGSQTIVQMFGSVTLARADQHLQLNADFSALYNLPDGTNIPPADAFVLVKVYQDQALVGTVTNSGRATDFILSRSNGIPAIVACAAALIDSPASPFLSFSLDAPAVLSDGSGQELQGNRFRVSPINPSRETTSLSALSLGTVNVPSFTIIAETSQPGLSIAQVQNTVVLSWPNENQPFALEATSDLNTQFQRVEATITVVGNRNTVTLPIDPSGNRFFRLVLASD